MNASSFQTSEHVSSALNLNTKPIVKQKELNEIWPTHLTRTTERARPYSAAAESRQLPNAV
jgi:hypothetical protein